MKTSETIGSLITALAAAQKSITNPQFDKVNPHFKSRYATLAAHLDAIRLPFAAEGLFIMQPISSDRDTITVTTRIAHKSGEWIEESATEPRPERCTIQQFGSICSYLRRYTLASMVSITGEDDLDGEEVVAPTRQHARYEPHPSQSATAKPAPAPAKAAPAPRPIETVEAVKEPARPSAPADKYPDNWEGKAVVLRVAERKGKPVAIQIDGEHGTAWITTDVPEFVTLAKDAGEGTLELSRVNGTLTIMRWRQPNVNVPAPTTELPF